MARDTPLGFPAHTLPYRRGEFTTLSTVSGQSQSGLPFHFGFLEMRILVQLRTGGNPVIHHQEIQALVTVLLMNSGDQHTLGINAHHLSGRQVHDGDGRLADQLFRLIIFMDAAQNHAIRALAVIQSELQQLLGLLHRFAGQDLHGTEIALGEGVKIHHVLEDGFDLHVGEVDLLLHGSRGRHGNGLFSLLVGIQRLHRREQFTVCSILSYYALLPHISHEIQNFFTHFAFILFYLVIVKCGKICGNTLKPQIGFVVCAYHIYYTHQYHPCQIETISKKKRGTFLYPSSFIQGTHRFPHGLGILA